ncbi:spermatogenesis associated 2-like [Cololabis saira]|uniref:spermatogenesis associated 2-like n=1 Tax=Cololabis saira TaxID=129043 RepID=UPI002AD1E984|nr:spermatogenesis associated 2-like [Cololabis saira]
MSSSQQKARDIVGVYNHILEKQIVEQGSSLPCRNEDLWMQVEDRLRNGDAQNTHCLGLDPLRVMEESLKAEAASAPATSPGRRLRVKAGLQGLARAFGVLEQASLNLYLGPWREEYRVIKMYSGTFTHYITPVLSMPQIEKLFGLLGYSLGPPEQLHLQSPRVSPASLDDFLRLSCAFFIARCECQLLVTALGKHVGDAKWELGVVKERQRGSILHVALENTRKKFEVKQPLPEPVDGEMDLYGDESGDGKACGVKFNAMPCPAERCISGEVCMSPSLELDTKNLPDSKSPDEFSCKSLMFGKTDSKQLAKAEAEPSQFCSCVHSNLSSLCLKQCFECKGLHYYNCDSLKVCKMNGHKVKFAGNPNESEEPSLPSGVSSDPPPYDSAAMPSLAPCDEPTPVSQSIHPISFHGCVDLAKPDPQVLCRSCSVFHSGSCREGDLCQTNHDICPLGVCSCGKLCSRKPLVLCRYCGREFCTNCWYRNPVSCICGQTFDQSSSV